MYRFHLEYYKDTSKDGFIDYITLGYDFWASVLDATIDEESAKKILY
jgi:hypothetical protein